MKPKIEQVDEKTSYLRAGHVKIRVAKLVRGKYTTFRISWKVGRKGFNRAYNDESAAMAEAHRILKNLLNADGAATEVAGQDLTYLTECQRRMGGIPLHKAVDFYLKYHEFTDLNPKTFSEVYDLFYERAAQRKLSRRYYETLRHHKTFWVDKFGAQFINTITPDEYVEHLTSSKYSDRSQRNLLATLTAILRFARKRRFVTDENTKVEADLGKLRRTTPEIYTPDDLKKLFIIADPRAIAYIAIMAFGGSRRSEASSPHFTARHIFLEDRMIRLDPEITKTGAGRTLEIPDNLAEWLKLFLKDEGEIFKLSRVKSPEKSVLDAVGLKMKPNGLRHSFCSYHLAMHRNSALTSDIAGNSPKILNENYKALVSKAAAEEWFSITPENVREFAKKNSVDKLLTW